MWGSRFSYQVNHEVSHPGFRGHASLIRTGLITAYNIDDLLAAFPAEIDRKGRLTLRLHFCV